MIDLILKGGPVMYPLVLCSVIALTVIIERLFFWIRAGKRRDTKLVDNILHLTFTGEYDRALAEAKESRDYVANIIGYGLTHSELDMEKNLEIATGDEIQEMKRGLAVLDTVITIAPLLGILGTVAGIIVSFNILGNIGIEDPRAVSGGIGQALITTAAGLVIAICTLIPYNYFNSKVDRAVERIEKRITQFEIAYEYPVIKKVKAANEN